MLINVLRSQTGYGVQSCHVLPLLLYGVSKPTSHLVEHRVLGVEITRAIQKASHGPARQRLSTYKNRLSRLQKLLKIHLSELVNAQLIQPSGGISSVRPPWYEHDMLH